MKPLIIATTTQVMTASQLILLKSISASFGNYSFAMSFCLHRLCHPARMVCAGTREPLVFPSTSLTVRAANSGGTLVRDGRTGFQRRRISSKQVEMLRSATNAPLSMTRLIGNNPNICSRMRL
jgi:hypothetical protein